MRGPQNAADEARVHVLHHRILLLEVDLSFALCQETRSFAHIVRQDYPEVPFRSLPNDQSEKKIRTIGFQSCNASMWSISISIRFCLDGTYKPGENQR